MDLDHHIDRSRKLAARIAVAGAWPDKRINEIQRCISRYASDLRKLQGLAQQGQIEKTRNLRQRVLLGYAGNAVVSLGKIEREAHQSATLPKISWEEFDPSVNDLPSRSGKPDLHAAWAEQKAKGGFRLVCDPGEKLRATHELLCQVLEASEPSAPHEYNLKGRGAVAAVAHIRQLILDGKMTHVTVFDVSNYFSSVKPKHLEWLKLPPRIVEECIFFLDALYPDGFYHHEGKSFMARHGLPQGAPASAKISSALLGRELRHIGGENGKMTYVDDGVIGACSRADAEEGAEALQERMASLHGGPIGLGKLEVCSVDEGFEILGYWIFRSIAGQEPKVICVPSHSARQKARKNLFERFDREGPGLTFDKATEIAVAYFENWRRSFTHWSPTQHQMDERLFEMECWIQDYFHGWISKQPPAVA